MAQKLAFKLILLQALFLYHQINEMSCCGGNCNCGSSCNCGSGCGGCKMCPDLAGETAVIVDLGASSQKGNTEMVSGFEGGNCDCTKCNCGGNSCSCACCGCN